MSFECEFIPNSIALNETELVLCRFHASRRVVLMICNFASRVARSFLDPEEIVVIDGLLVLTGEDRYAAENSLFV